MLRNRIYYGLKPLIPRPIRMKVRRRLLIAACLGTLTGWRRASAQERRVRRIGFLAPLSRSTPAQPDVFYDAFVQGMRELGYEA